MKGEQEEEEEGKWRQTSRKLGEPDYAPTSLIINMLTFLLRLSLANNLCLLFYLFIFFAFVSFYVLYIFSWIPLERLNNTTSKAIPIGRRIVAPIGYDNKNPATPASYGNDWMRYSEQ